MTPDAFRAMALALPQTEEKSHFGKADFRVRNKIFATLKDDATGVVKLLPEQQEMMTAAEPRIFVPVNGGWGRQGWTQVILASADAEFRAQLAAQGTTWHTPRKKPKGKKLTDLEKYHNRCVSRLRQPIEGLFNWFNDKTGLQDAGTVRSAEALYVQVGLRLLSLRFQPLIHI